MNKYIGAIAVTTIGIVGTLVQVYIVREHGRYWLLGGISTAFIVMGIASFFIDIKGSKEEGSGSSKSFGDLPMNQKIVLGLALLAGIAHAAYFGTGMVMNY